MLAQGIQLLYSFIDFLFPPRCILCGAGIASSRLEALCSHCAGYFTGPVSPMCPRCGMTFPSREGADHVCSRCLQQDVFFDAARALARYEGAVRMMIHRLKYRGQTILAKPLGTVMADHGRYLLPADGYKCIVPVPLHSTRLRERGYNQSVLLARCIGRRWKVPVEYRGLRKIRSTVPQAMLPVKDRVKNVRGVFCWTGASLQGAHVLLVDDVMTSGSTVDECARVLKRSGALRVDVLTLARTP
ncbi:MAG: ComF family protein [Desulfobacterota bacterium]|nr:ComF family protein [Thermodesulfobacteriota bacterium]